MRKSFTEGLVRLTTGDIFKPYKKLETPTWGVFGVGSVGNWTRIPSAVWRDDGVMWEMFTRGAWGSINTRSRRIPIQREEEK